MDYQKNRTFIIQWLLLLGATIAWYLYQSLSNRNIWFYAMGAIGAVVLLIFLVVCFVKPKKPLTIHVKASASLILALILVLAVIISACFFSLHYGFLDYSAFRMMMAVGVAGFGALLLNASGSKRNVYFDFALILLTFGVLNRSFAFLVEIQSTPFSLGWSEGSRLYNSSLIASRQVYGKKMPLGVIYPSRYLMQAVPFWLGIRSIVVHRIWLVFLWLGMTLWSAIVLAKRVKDGLKLPMVWLTLFFFLFFFQGAVYYHMMVCVLLILYGYHKDKPWRTLIFVVLASLWAGISRVNWMPLPALLAVLIYLIETPFSPKRWLRYLQFPALWTILGLMASLIGKRALICWSGEPAFLFNSAFTSPLLWERLLPNNTFFIGILPGILLICLPLMVLFVCRMRGKWQRVHWLRWLGMAGILLAFFAGGIVVSVKIGGGGDLHNLDAFIFLFAVLSSYILAGHLSFETKPKSNISETKAHQAQTPLWQAKPFWLAMAVIVPVFFAFMRAGKWSFTDNESDLAELEELKIALQSENLEDGPVLFISEPQLIAFGELDDIAMVYPYEKLFLMEMAMSENQTYLQAFYEQLENHDFVAIVTDPVSTMIQDRSRPFNEENNAWVRHVVIPMLEQYELTQSFKGGEINLLLPKH